MLQQSLSQGLIIALIISFVPLLLASCGGLFISMIQAATQIQEQTLSYLIKFIIIATTLTFGWKFVLASLTGLITELFISASFF